MKLYIASCIVKQQIVNIKNIITLTFENIIALTTNQLMPIARN